jgi:glutamate 5-kinase
LRQAGKQVILVSSGAIACGMQRLGWRKRPHAVHELQAAAAVGQMGLAQVYESAFAATDCTRRRSCSPTTTSPIASATSMPARR